MCPPIRQQLAEVLSRRIYDGVVEDSDEKMIFADDDDESGKKPDDEPSLRGLADGHGFW